MENREQYKNEGSIPVKIRITGVHRQPDTGQEEETVTSCTGTYRRLGDFHCILYEENGERVLIRISLEQMQIHRSGKHTSDLVFHPLERKKSLYATPYGTMEMETEVSRYETDLQEEPFRMTQILHYRLFMQGHHVSDARLLLIVGSDPLAEMPE